MICAVIKKLQNFKHPMMIHYTKYKKTKI